MNPENFPEVGIGSVLIEYGQRHRAVRGESVDGLIAEVGSAKSSNATSAASAPAARRACSPFVPCSTRSRKPWGLPPTATTTPAAAACRK